MKLKKIPRAQNLADMLTHTPSAKELEVFLAVDWVFDVAVISEKDSGGDEAMHKPVPART